MNQTFVPPSGLFHPEDAANCSIRKANVKQFHWQRGLNVPLWLIWQGCLSPPQLAVLEKVVPRYNFLFDCGHLPVICQPFADHFSDN